MEDLEIEAPYVYGATTLLKECQETVAALFASFERAEGFRAKRRIVESALHELKVRATIEELVLLPALGREPDIPDSERRDVRRLIAELETMNGDERRHDEGFAALRTALARIPPILALGALLFAPGARAQNNQTGGVLLNPNTYNNTIAKGGSTGAAMPVNQVVPPPAPSADEAPADSKKLSDWKLARKIRRAIAQDPAIAKGSRKIKVAAEAGKVVVSGTALNEGDKGRILAKAAALAGAENVVDGIEVAAPSR